MTYLIINVELNFWRIGMRNLFFKTCSATSSMSLVSWSYLLILNILVNLISLAVHAEMTHLLLYILKELYPSMLNNFWYVLQSTFKTFNVSATRRRRDIKILLPVIGPRAKKFNIVSNDHGRTQVRFFRFLPEKRFR